MIEKVTGLPAGEAGNGVFITSPWIMVRIDRETHTELAKKANSAGSTLNNVVRKLLRLPVRPRFGPHKYRLVEEVKEEVE